MKIIIVEDHRIFRELIRKTCVAELRYEVVGETDSGNEALDLIGVSKPDVVILDLSLKTGDGFTVAMYLRRVFPHVKILILSCSVDEYTVFRLGKIGIEGFVDKATNSVAELKFALRKLNQGGTYFSQAFSEVRSKQRANTSSFDKLLSASEQKVLTLIGTGHDDSEIAARLKISPTTAQTHRSHLLRKLQIHGTPKLIAFAIKLGFTIGINF